MQPYFQDGVVTLYHGNSLEITDWLSADVLITDPPYGMSYKSDMNKGERNRTVFHDRLAGDENPEVRNNALRLWGTEKAALVFGTWRIERPEHTKQLVIWDKSPCGFMGNTAIPFGPTHEDIYCLGTIGWSGKRQPSIINVPMLMSGDLSRPNHPTPKPIPLMEILISKTSGTIADPFAGSGATLVAARNLGRKIIGVEVEEKYCEIIANRLSQQIFDFGSLYE